MSRILIIGDACHLSEELGAVLKAVDLPLEFAVGQAEVLEQLHSQAFGVVITSCESNVEEDLAWLAQMRSIRPGLKCIVLARSTTPDEVVAALRDHVFACYTPPFSAREIARVASYAAMDSEWKDDIQVLSAKPTWLSVRVNCRMVTAERLMTFERELTARLPEHTRREMMQALREILMNAMEHGAAFNPERTVEVKAIHARRSFVFYVRDPGTGFRLDQLKHAAIANPPDNPAAHVLEREKAGMRPGGYGLLVASGTVDELIFNEIGNEVILIKYLTTGDGETA
jgi:anti-sigma regulatory factor (Ser/Thr protein kinase)